MFMMMVTLSRFDLCFLFIVRNRTHCVTNTLDNYHDSNTQDYKTFDDLLICMVQNSIQYSIQFNIFLAIIWMTFMVSR